MEKKSWKKLEGNFYDRQRQPSNIQCACGCGGYVSNRVAKAKLKGTTEGYLKGHGWKGKKMSESARQKMRENHADVSGSKNPNYGKGLFGADNPNWQGGKVANLYPTPGNQPGVGRKHDREFRRQIKKRDGSQCVLCANKICIETHHIEPWAEREDLRFDPENVITLCKPCHVRADNRYHKDRIKPMLKAYIDGLKSNS